MTTADIDTLRRWVGAVSTAPDETLQEALDAATAHVADRVIPERFNRDDVQQAILMIAHRLYQRRQSPEGSAGFGADGVVVRILGNDPDVNRLLARSMDYSSAETGIGIG